jgi:hypothetical protein
LFSNEIEVIIYILIQFFSEILAKNCLKLGIYEIKEIPCMGE